MRFSSLAATPEECTPAEPPVLLWIISAQSGEWARAFKANPTPFPRWKALDSLKLAVDRFIAFASQHPEYKFLVTPIGCGIAGYRESQIGPMFEHAAALPNVCLPASFWAVL